MQDGRERRRSELLLAGAAEQLFAFAQARLQGDRLQAVFRHGAQLDQLLSVTEHAQHFTTRYGWSMQTRKLLVGHQLPNEFGVAPIILLPPTSATPDLGGMTEPDFVTEFLEQGFKPGAVTAGLQAHDHLTLELLVESTHLLFVLVPQCGNDEFASFSFQITDGLLPCMKVNADIYFFHSASFQSHAESCS